MPTTDQPSPAMVRAAQIGYYTGYVAGVRGRHVPEEVERLIADQYPQHTAFMEGLCGPIAQRAQQDHPATPCRWTQCNTTFATECGHQFESADADDVLGGEMTFCCFCGSCIEAVSEEPDENPSPRPMIQVAPGREELAKGFLRDFAKQAALSSLATHRIAAAPKPEPELRIVRNSARCRKCGDEIVSRHRHDFVRCKCGAIAVDGGTDYLKRAGNLDDMEQTSISEPAATEPSRNPCRLDSQPIDRPARAEGAE